MNKGLIIIVFVIIILIAIYFLFFQKYEETTKGGIVKIETFCDEIKDNNLNLWCQAITKKDSSLCTLNMTSSMIENCFEDIAILTGDSSLCLKVPEPYENIIPSATDECYYYVAIYNGNESICNSISYESLKSSCYGSLGFKINMSYLCYKSKGYIRDRCFLEVAINTGNITLCDELDFLDKEVCLSTVSRDPNKCITESIKYECLNRYYSNLAKITGDESYCSNVDIKDLCYCNIAKYHDRPELCEKTSSSIVCYYSMLPKALEIGKVDLNICRNSTTPESCFLTLVRLYYNLPTMGLIMC